MLVDNTLLNAMDVDSLNQVVFGLARSAERYHIHMITPGRLSLGIHADPGVGFVEGIGDVAYPQRTRDRSVGDHGTVHIDFVKAWRADQRATSRGRPCQKRSP